MIFLGIDVGSSSIKVALVDQADNKLLGQTSYPKKEMKILAPQEGWAEQSPEDWWQYTCLAIKELLSQGACQSTDVRGIGIAYQMHGLVLLDKEDRLLYPSIIWCDSRAVGSGTQLLNEVGEDYAFDHLLNAPGNFTASKLHWIKQHKPDIYDQIHTVMLPGDYIAFRLTGEKNTTVSGLSEGTFYDFRSNSISKTIVNQLELSEKVFPPILDTFSRQGQVSNAAAAATGLSIGTPVNYRAGDQPNNAFSLGALHAGDIAATGGTSGVVYGVVDQLVADRQGRVNTFAHVNYQPHAPRLGVLLCINGAGILYSWLRKQIAADSSFTKLENRASGIPVGSEGLRMLPFGNGAERMLGNKNLGSQIINLQFNRHSSDHLIRAALEGVAFSFVYGMQLLADLGITINKLKVGDDNLFQSNIFSSTIANTMDISIEVMNTSGAVGAAKAASKAISSSMSLDQVVGTIKETNRFIPQGDAAPYTDAFDRWKQDLLNHTDLP